MKTIIEIQCNADEIADETYYSYRVRVSIKEREYAEAILAISTKKIQNEIVEYIDRISQHILDLKDNSNISILVEKFWRIE